MKNIIILSASSNKNLNLANVISNEVIKQGGNSKVIDLSAFELPLYTSLQAKESTPEDAINLMNELNLAEAIVTVAPEYNGGIPPVLTNAISWISVSGSENWRSCFNGKKALVATHSGSGGMHVLMAMRMQLSYLGMNVLGRQIQTHYNKELSQTALEDVVSQLLS